VPGSPLVAIKKVLAHPSSCFSIAVYIWPFRVVVLSDKSSIGLGTVHAIQQLFNEFPPTGASKSSHSAISSGRDAQFS
jgi:hypothetical protein